MTHSDIPINISDLHERHHGVTSAIGGTFFEAACVCLSRHHEAPIQVDVVLNDITTSHPINFVKPDNRTLGAWANDIDTTETGAYGVCLAAVEMAQSLVAVRRAETLTGADWYVAPIGDIPEDLEDCFRLEVSGVDTGDRSVVARRLKQKVAQTKKGASNVPAIASVVGFKERVVSIERVGTSK
jgi:hypothetical protein